MLLKKMEKKTKEIVEDNIIMILLYYDRELFVLRILHYSSEVV